MKKLSLNLLGIILLNLISVFMATSQTVTPWITSSDKSKLIAQQPTVSFGANSGTNPATITLTPTTTYQSIDGFGYTLTEGSAEVISGMATTQQNALLNDVYNLNMGLGVSMIRISIGASDLSSSNYSYNDTSGDVNMNNFSLAGPDLTYLIPIIKKILLINPNVKILATPWSPPKWMKSNNSYVGGNLNTSAYTAYANYFVKYIQAMNAQGINIWGITPQNEPENPNNNPSMSMNSTEQKNFINNNLGPAMSSAGFGSIKIIAFDHNCDNTAYPTDVCNNSSYVDGAAFHLYSGNISAMTTVHNNTNKNVYFTEQYTGSGGNFAGDFPWHTQNVVQGSINNWSKAVFEWNLANNASIGPYTQGGCNTCLGAITVNNSTTYTKNVAFYIIGQLSKFVKTGALRIGSSSSSSTLTTTALKNPDGSFVVSAYNSAASAVSMKVVNGSNSFTYSIPATSSATFVWSGGTANVPVTGVSLNPTSATISANASTQLTATVAPSNATNKSVSWSSSNTGVATVSSSGVVTGVAAGTATITVTTASGAKTATCAITVLSLTTSFPGYYNIFSRNSGKGLDVANNATNSGAGVQQYDITNGGGANQRWKFVSTGGGNYNIIVKSTQMCLCPSGAGTTNGEKIQQKTCGTGAEFKWTVTSLGGGFYKVINLNSGKSLDVENVSTTNGALIQVWDYTGGNNQQWSFTQVEATARMSAENYEDEKDSFEFFPNPTNDNITIKSASLQDYDTISILSTGGMDLSNQPVNEGVTEQTISLKTLNTGIYFLRLNGEKKNVVQKIIKQ